MPTTTPTILDQISAEKTKIGERLARLDADRETIATQLTDLETAERVLMRVSKTTPARRPRSASAAEMASVAKRDRGRPPRAASSKSAARAPGARSPSFMQWRSRQGDLGVAREALAAAIGQADELLAMTPDLYGALDARALALCGLSLCGDIEQTPFRARGVHRCPEGHLRPRGCQKGLVTFDALAQADVGPYFGSRTTGCRRINNLSDQARIRYYASDAVAVVSGLAN